MRQVVPLLAVLLTAFAPAPLPRPSRGGANEADLKALQGVWNTVSLDVNNTPIDPSGATTTFQGRRMSCASYDVVSVRWNFRVDAARTPKTLDLSDDKGRVLRCIYRLEGDRLTLCFSNRIGGARPAEFRAAEGVGLEVLRRVRR